MNMGELTVGTLQIIKRDGTCGASGGAADLRDAELETGGEIDAHPVFGAGYRVADRLANRLDNPGHLEMAAPCFDVDLELNRPEQRFQLVWRHGRIHPPHGRHVISLLARQNFQQRVALSGIGTLVNDDLHRAVAFMHRARIIIQANDSYPIEPNRAELT